MTGQSRRGRMLTFLLTFAVVAYATFLVALYFAQTSLLFPGAPDAPPFPGQAEHLLIESEGERLHGVLIPATTGRPKGSDAVLLAFGGNAWNADAAAGYLHDRFPDTDIVLFHYRGYPPSTGSPSAAAFRRDALVIHDMVARRFPGRPIIVAGFSLGSGVAAFLASQRRLAGIILVTPFDSLWRVASHQYPWLPVRLLFRHDMEAASDLRGVDMPVAVIAAEHDRLIPGVRTDALRRAIPRLVFDRTIPGTGHVDIYEDAAFKIALVQAVGELRNTSASTSS